MKNKTKYLLIIILVVAAIGYVSAFIQYKANIKLEKYLLKSDLKEIGIIDSDIVGVRDGKTITIEELKKSKESIQRLIDAAADQDTTELSLNDALKILEGLK